MTPRFNPRQAAPEAYQAIRALDQTVKAKLDKMVLHLVKLRASQLNGCAFCIDLHVKEALADGEKQQRLHLVAAWRESPLFTEKERAVLAWTESLTLLAQRGAPEAEYQALRQHFSEAEVASLSVAVGVINTWNRLVLASGMLHPVDG